MWTFVVEIRPSVKFEGSGLLSSQKSDSNKGMISAKKMKAELVAILLFGVSTFLGLAIFSYEATDTSFHTLSWGKPVQNWCGFVGSFLSDGALRLFGAGSWIMVLHGILLAIKIGFRHHFEWSWTRVAWGASLFIMTITLIQTYLENVELLPGNISSGGLIGLVLSKGFVLLFNAVGAKVVFWVTWCFCFVMYFEKAVTDVLKFLLAKVVMGVGLLFRIGSKLIISGINQMKDRARELYSIENASVRSSIPRLGKLNKSRAELQDTTLETSLAEPSLDEDLGSLNEGAIVNPAILDHDVVDAPASEKRKVKLKIKREQQVENWSLPKLELVEDPPASRIRVDNAEIKDRARILKEKLSLFGVTGEVVAAKAGPAVTLYEFRPDSSVKISKITELADDLAMALSSESLRIIAPIPGRDVVGIETANKQRETVYHKDMLAEEKFWSEDFKLPMALGRKVDGSIEIADLRKMPHLLIAGTTGSGKSVFTVSTIIGLIFKHSPKTLKLILIDPKQVDLAAFESIPHLAMPLVTDSKQAVQSLKWAVGEMEKRYKSMSCFGARGLEAFNEAVEKLSSDQKKEHEQINFEYETTPGKRGEMYYFEPQPYLVIVVEEFADLMSVDKGNVEQSVIRLAQKARACGIHLILCLQSPRKEFVTGAIKSNIPGRIAFKAASSMESRIILDETGAERLLASGDMLYRGPGSSHVIRHHGPFLKDQDIANITEFWSDQSEPIFDDAILAQINGTDSENSGYSESFDEEQDVKYQEIVHWMQSQKEVSASLIQRRFGLGYPRAARLIESFERNGIVGPANGSKPRSVLIHNLSEL